MSSEKSIVKPRKSARSAAKQAAAAAMTAEPASPTAKMPLATAAAADASHPKPPRVAKPAVATGIKDTDLDLVSDDLYGRLKDEVVMELLEGLRTELTPMYNESISSQGGSSLSLSSSASSCGSEAGSSSTAAEDLLWHLRATPAMMRALSATVRAAQPSAVEAR